MIEIEFLTFRYEAEAPFVFSGFTASVAPGVTLVRGQSGCGKSTLLRLVAGFLVPQQGKIVIYNGGGPTRTFQKYALGFLFQGLNLLPHTNLLRNYELTAGVANVPTEIYMRRIYFWSDKLGITNLLKEKPSRLSQGQQQRAAFVRAIIREPYVLCLDEPTSGLDDANCEIMRQAILDYASENRYCLIASHDERLFPAAKQIIDLDKNRR